jgi:glycerol-3-phosphate acyltransferase PlsY
VNLSHFALLVAGYLAGSIPFGLMLGRAVKGIDLRDFGSGNIGATNAGRVLGTKWGLICLVLDAFKGLLPVALFPRWICGADPSPDGLTLDDLAVLAGVATIVGHMFPCWLGFRGGKGVATSLGVIAMLSPWGLLVGAVAFFGTLAVFRIVSLSSITAAVCFGLFYLTPWSGESTSLGLFSAAVPLLIVIQHRSNVKRLLRGEEPRLGSKPRLPTAEPPNSAAS